MINNIYFNSQEANIEWHFPHFLMSHTKYIRKSGGSSWLQENMQLVVKTVNDNN